MTRGLRVSVLVCTIAASIVSVSRADVSYKLSNEQLATTADAIVIGRATGASSRWVGRTLVTAVTVHVDESLKGGVSGSIEVILPGGTDANRRIPVAMSFPGAPTMRDGEQVFLFLSVDPEVGGYIVSGFAQGKFSIVTDARGERRVSRDLRGSQLVEGTGVSRGTTTLVSLAAFRDEVSGYLAVR